MSFLRRQESVKLTCWITAFAGMTKKRAENIAFSE